MYKRLLFFCSLLGCLFFPTNNHAQSLADEKAFVSALQKEVQQQYLQFRNREVPICSLIVHLETTDDYLLSSSMGSLMTDQHQTQRTMSVQLMVGNLQSGNIAQARTEGETILLPLDYNIPAIVQILQNEIERAYFAAENRFLEREYLEKLEKKPFEPRYFSERELYVSDFTAPGNAEISLEACKSYLNESTRLWNTFGKEIQGWATLHYVFSRRYDFMENGDYQTENQNYTTLTLAAEVKGEGNNPIRLEKQFLSEFPTDLPDVNSLQQEETSLFEQLQRLVDAPAAAAVTAPVLLSNQAAALVLYATRNADLVTGNMLASKEDKSHFSVIAANTLDDAELYSRLKQTLKAQKQDFGYWVKSVRFSETGEMIPQELVRVYADSRADELVCGTSLTMSPNMVWSQAMACGKQTDCSVAPENITQTRPVVCCAPAVLFYQMEFKQRPAQPQLTLLTPVQEVPSIGNQSFSSLVEQVMQDEIRIFFEDTNLQETPKPYDLEFWITDAHTCSIQSSLGSVLSVNEQPLRTVHTRLLVGNDEFNNEHLSVPSDIQSDPLPLDNQYEQLLQSLHQSVNQAYTQSLWDYSQKMRRQDHASATMRKNRLPDRSSVKRQSFFLDETMDEMDVPRLQSLAAELSAQFLPEKDNLCRSGVNIQVFQSMVYYTSAQNTRCVRPFNLFQIQWFAQTVTDEGDTLSDQSCYVASSLNNLPDVQEEIRGMVQRLLELKNAPKAAEYYEGPVLVSQEAASDLLLFAFLESSPTLLAVHPPLDKTSFQENFWEKMKNKQVISPVLTVSARYDSEKEGDVSLLGYYPVDAEGVPVSKTTELIHNGTLLDMLSSRSPSKIGRFSNGHCRLALCNGKVVPVVGAGVLEISSRNAMGDKELMKELLKQARVAGKKYAYQIVKFGIRRTEEGRKVLFPLYAYQIKASNGEKTLVRVRGGENFTADLLQQVTATSSEKNVFNKMSDIQNVRFEDEQYPLNGIPVSLIAPGHFLFKSMKMMP